MSQPPSRDRRPVAAIVRRAATRLTLLVALLLGLAGLQPALGQAADATVTQADLCEAWNAGASNPEIVLESGLKITGSSLQRSGSSCTAEDASISVSNSAITEVAPTSGGNAASRILAAVTREVAASTNDLKVGDEVFKGAVIRSLTTQIQVGFIGIRGGIEIQWTGGTVTKLQFSGKLYGVNRYSMTLSSPVDGTKLPNVGGDAIKFNGDLVRDSSGTRLNLTGSAPSIVLGEGDQQLTVTNGNLSLKLADEQAGTGLRLTAAGSITLGNAVKLTGATVNALFDDTGLLSFQGGGALGVTIPASGSSPAGSVNGNAQLAYERGGAQSVTFTATRALVRRSSPVPPLPRRAGRELHGQRRALQRRPHRQGWRRRHRVLRRRPHRPHDPEPRRRSGPRAEGRRPRQERERQHHRQGPHRLRQRADRQRRWRAVGEGRGRRRPRLRRRRSADHHPQGLREPRLGEGLGTRRGLQGRRHLRVDHGIRRGFGRWQQARVQGQRQARQPRPHRRGRGRRRHLLRQTTPATRSPIGPVLRCRPRRATSS